MLERAASAGNVGSQRQLGEALLKGQGVVKDKAHGLELLETAAKQDSWAQITLADLYFAGVEVPQDVARGIELLTAAAAKNPYAQAVLGNKYLLGTDIPQDQAKGWLCWNREQLREAQMHSLF